MLYSKYFLLNNSREANSFPENVIEALSCLTRGVPVHSDNNHWVHKNKTGLRDIWGGFMERQLQEFLLLGCYVSALVCTPMYQYYRIARRFEMP